MQEGLSSEGDEANGIALAQTGVQLVTVGLDASDSRRITAGDEEDAKVAIGGNERYLVWTKNADEKEIDRARIIGLLDAGDPRGAERTANSIKYLTESRFAVI